MTPEEMSAAVCRRQDLLQEDSPNHWIFDTAKCYICGVSNYARSHLNVNGFPTSCPTGITREQADTVRRLRGEHFR